MTTWDEWLRQHGIDPDELRPGETVEIKGGGNTPAQGQYPTGAVVKATQHRWAELWQVYGNTALEYEFEYPFAKPERRWRADVAFLPQKVIVEFDGMFARGGRHEGAHRSINGYVRNMEKLNGAAERGWYVLRFPTAALWKPAFGFTPEGIIQQVVRTLRARTEGESNGT